MNSSPLIRVDPHTALTGPDLLTPAPGAELTPVVQNGDVFAEINVHRRKVASLLTHRRCYDSCSLCVGVTSPVRTLQIAFGANVFQIRPVA